MPIYEYTCVKCQERFSELIRNRADEQALRCPKCGHDQVARQLSTFAAHAEADRPTHANPGCGACCQPGGTCPWNE